jgi:uncharacterized membrane protein YeaQ/YmgE (transglycosylase-associated protein family)
MDKSQLIALIVAGQAGAHAAALAFPDRSLGRIKNALAGLAGGGLGAAMLAVVQGLGPEVHGLVQTIAGGGLGGALLVFAIGWISRRRG